MSHSANTLMLVLAALLCGASAQSLTFRPTNVTGPYGTGVTGAPVGAAGTSATSTTLGPCVLRTLHTHAFTELLYVTEGSLLSIQFDPESGSLNYSMLATPAAAAMSNGTEIAPRAVAYPAGYEHLQYNPTCEPASFVAFFGTDVPGIKTVNLNSSALTAAVMMAKETNPDTVAEIEQELADIALAFNMGPIPAGYMGNSAEGPAGPFTPVAAATFAFPASEAMRMQDSCLKACNLM